MKKQELIHLHGLLAEVRYKYEQKSGAEVEPEEYDGLGCRPTSIHKSKTDHKKAVFALAGGITSEMKGDASKAAPASAD
jgi:hypothetical protein